MSGKSRKKIAVNIIRDLLRSNNTFGQQWGCSCAYLLASSYSFASKYSLANKKPLTGFCGKKMLKMNISEQTMF